MKHHREASPHYLRHISILSYTFTPLFTDALRFISFFSRKLLISRCAKIGERLSLNDAFAFSISTDLPLYFALFISRLKKKRKEKKKKKIHTTPSDWSVPKLLASLYRRAQSHSENVSFGISICNILQHVRSHTPQLSKRDAPYTA